MFIQLAQSQTGWPTLIQVYWGKHCIGDVIFMNSYNVYIHVWSDWRPLPDTHVFSKLKLFFLYDEVQYLLYKLAQVNDFCVKKFAEIHELW